MKTSSFVVGSGSELHLFLFGSAISTTASFTSTSRIRTHSHSPESRKQLLRAAPKRLDENVEGILYVNDRCINCAACSNFAPTVFERGSKFKHVVYKQPTLDNRNELEEARAALAACPVAAIRVESKVTEESDAKLKRELSMKPIGDEKALFPRQISSEIDLGVYYLGHHNEGSFGAIPYLVLGKSAQGSDISVMIDVPKFSHSSVNAVKSLSPPSGPTHMFLTHVDDTADHNKWAKEFPNMKRIFHAGDLGRHNWIGDSTLENVEILLKGKAEDCAKELMLWDINGNQIEEMQPMQEEEIVILHTPGHSPGSISLLFRPKFDSVHSCNGVLFTGDSYSWTTRDGGHMSGFPRYGNDLSQQAQTLKLLGELSHLWDVVAPGHGHLRSYMNLRGKENVSKIKEDDIHTAVSELLSY